jgi:hypothetical protein
MAGKHTIEGNTGSQGRASQVPGSAIGKRGKTKGQSASQTGDADLDETQKEEELEMSDSEDEIEDDQLEEELDDEEEDLEEENEGGR